MKLEIDVNGTVFQKKELKEALEKLAKANPNILITLAEFSERIVDQEAANKSLRKLLASKVQQNLAGIKLK